MQTLVFEETINTMTFIEYLTWNTTVFSLNVIELESLFSTFFSGRGVGMPILLIHYSYPQQQCNSSNTQMTLCDNQKRKTKEDFWIFYDRRKGMSYHHAKHTLGQITMCFLLFSILNKECVNSFYQNELDKRMLIACDILSVSNTKIHTYNTSWKYIL